jgi:predicted Zn-dependent protease
LKFKRTVAAIVAAGLSVCLYFNVFAYVLSGKSWPNSEASIYSTGSSDGNFNDAFVQAMNSWNNLSNFTFHNLNGYADPCANPFISDRGTGWEFRYDDCGAAFGSGTLAVNYSWTIGNEIIQAGTVFNANQPWDVHNGPSHIYYDFRRVAAHELGHALGLRHETIQTALMNPFYSGNIQTPQTDDITGLRAIYENSTGVTPVYRFFNSVSNCHFYTISQVEKNNLICCDPNMDFEGIAWYAYPNQQLNTVPVYRFYSEVLKYHFYTADETEKERLVCCDPVWHYEGIAWYIYPDQQENTVPVYRFYNSALPGHFYTVGDSEKDRLICCDPSWNYEGIAYFAITR